MLPTFPGRIQTRLFLTLVIGLPITLIYALIISGAGPTFTPLLLMLLGVLGALFIVGVILDPIYILIQWLRWDSDWPFAYQFFFTIVEFALVLTFASLGWVPWINEALFDQPGTYRIAIGHFLWIFFIGFFLITGPLAAFFIRWRYKGGQFGRL